MKAWRDRIQTVSFLQSYTLCKSISYLGIHRSSIDLPSNHRCVVLHVKLPRKANSNTKSGVGSLCPRKAMGKGHRRTSPESALLTSLHVIHFQPVSSCFNWQDRWHVFFSCLGNSCNVLFFRDSYSSISLGWSFLAFNLNENNRLRRRKQSVDAMLKYCLSSELSVSPHLVQQSYYKMMVWILTPWP